MSTFETWISRYKESFTTSVEVSVDWVAHAGRDQLLEFLQTIGDDPPRDPARERMMQMALQRWVRRAAAAQLAPDSELVDHIEHVYRSLGESSNERYQLLQLLANVGGELALQRLATLLAASPPAETTQVALILSPLLQPERRSELTLLFPRLFDAIGHLSTASAVLDLANFSTRNGVFSVHPGADRSERLAAMLGDLALRLEHVDERGPADGEDRQQHRLQIIEGVPLAVALCDTLALIGDKRHIGMLYRVLELRHRRVQTEAAAALAKLGEEAGHQKLVELAAEPIARLRVLAYAKELGILEKIDPKFQSDEAQAESSLALWLAEPSQLGLPPTSLALIDQRVLSWPGYDEPVPCCLFRFEYELGAGRYSNVGIAGPLTHAFAASLEDLPPDDIYAAFAGWHAEHAEIRDQPADASAADTAMIAEFTEKLAREGFADAAAVTIGDFFGEQLLVAKAKKEGREGIAVVSDEATDWWPGDTTRHPIGAYEALCIFKGRRLLAAFN